ncbi:MAG: peptide chain release factor N(5)-glutamine methyltransferase [Lachnospiraceae bacterium]
MTLFRLFTEGKRKLEQTGNPDAENDARLLLLAAFQLESVHYLLNRMQELEDNDFNRSSMELYRCMVAKRCRRYPLQQIVGNQEFMGLSFLVNKHVLIPRQDTETLVELVLEEQKNPDLRVLDLCTGSGCIAISLAVKGRYRSVTASDVSEEALRVATHNRDRLCGDDPEIQVRLLQGDLFQVLESDDDTDGLFDIITANPPYIPTAVIRTLEPEVRDFEPVIALDGTEDGLYYYRILAREAKAYLNVNGNIYMEIGYDQGEAVSSLFREQGYHNVRVIKDLQHNDRVVCAAWNKEIQTEVKG